MDFFINGNSGEMNQPWNVSAVAVKEVLSIKRTSPEMPDSTKEYLLHSTKDKNMIINLTLFTEDKSVKNKPVILMKTLLVVSMSLVSGLAGRMVSRGHTWTCFNYI